MHYRNIQKIHTNSLKKGYTLLFAMLLSTVVLSVGISILTIARKEVILTGNSRESHRAILAADSGIQCAAFWNFDLSKFPEPQQTGTFDPAINCQNSQITVSRDNEIGNEVTYSWNINDPAAKLCAKVIINKKQIQVGTETTVQTTFESRGYNVECSRVGSSPNVVERALRYTR